jgi:regulator of nonsense transcripts 2
MVAEHLNRERAPSTLDPRSESLLEHRSLNISALETPVQLSHTLDSSMKKNLSFVKKLKQVTSENVNSLLTEVSKLKVDKYLAEITTSILDNFSSTRKPLAADLDALLAITCHLHRRFTAQFTPSLVEGLLAAFILKPVGNIAEKEEKDRLSKGKPLLRFLTDCYLAGLLQHMHDDSTGVFPSPSKLKKDARGSYSPQTIADELYLSIFRALISDKTLSNLPLVIALIQRHFQYLVPSASPNMHAVPNKFGISAELQNQFKEGFEMYFTQVCNRLIREHREVMKLRIKNREWYYEKGYEAPEDVKQRLERSEMLIDFFSSNAHVLATFLQRDMPQLNHESEVPGNQASTQIVLHKQDRRTADVGVWEDEDQRSFYEDLPELELYLPPSLLQDVPILPSETLDEVTSNQNEPTDSLNLKPSEVDVVKDDPEEDANLESDLRDLTISENPTAGDIAGETAGEDDEEVVHQSNLSALLQRIPQCDSRELIDSAAIEFCHYITRNSPKRLARVLLDVRGRVDMLSFYARMLAILRRFGIHNLVVKEVEQTFRRQIRSSKIAVGAKNAMQALEVKLVTARYLSELVKFKLVRDEVVFFCIKLLLDVFNAHTVEGLCHLLEGCGRILNADPNTHARMAEMLDRLGKQKKRLTDQRLVLMVESAIHSCVPCTGGSTFTQKVRDVEDEYLTHLLSNLNRDNVKHFVTQLRKFPWNVPKTFRMAAKRFSKLKEIRLDQLEHLANSLSLISKYYPDLSITVVDNILEDVKSGLEVLNRLHLS